MREAAAVAEVRLLFQQSVGDHLVARGGRDEEFAGRLVARMVDRRQPPAGLVGPVVAEERPLAVPVLADPQAGGWDSAIGYRIRAALARFRRRVQDDSESVGLVLMGDRGVSGLDPGDRHPFARCGRRQVERELLHAVLEEPQVDERLTFDLVGLVAQGESEGVVDGVDARLTRVGVGGAGGDEEHNAEQKR